MCVKLGSEPSETRLLQFHATLKVRTTSRTSSPRSCSRSRSHASETNSCGLPLTTKRFLSLQNFSTFLSAWRSSRGVVPDLFGPTSLRHKSVMRLSRYAGSQRPLWCAQNIRKTKLHKAPWASWAPVGGFTEILS